MLKNLGRWIMPCSSPVLQIYARTSSCRSSKCDAVKISLNVVGSLRFSSIDRCRAGRRVIRYDEEDEDEENGHNEQIALLEMYTQSARAEALIVHALVDEDEVEVLIFKGFSSCLSYGTSPDPSRSVIPARAVIKSIDRIRGPFDPSNIEYLQKSITWDKFNTTYLLS